MMEALRASNPTSPAKAAAEGDDGTLQSLLETYSPLETGWRYRAVLLLAWMLWCDGLVVVGRRLGATAWLLWCDDFGDGLAAVVHGLYVYWVAYSICVLPRLYDPGRLAQPLSGARDPSII